MFILGPLKCFLCLQYPFPVGKSLTQFNVGLDSILESVWFREPHRYSVTLLGTKRSNGYIVLLSLDFIVSFMQQR